VISPPKAEITVLVYKLWISHLRHIKVKHSTMAQLATGKVFRSVAYFFSIVSAYIRLYARQMRATFQEILTR
jgi:hypothetical protein